MIPAPEIIAALEFTAFPKIPRWSRDIVITEKIDGSNGSIYIPEDKSYILAGSRNRWLTPGKGDNFGFAGWVQVNADELIKLGPGRHFGEWWGLGIQRGYGLTERRFSLFNTSRWHEIGHAVKVLPKLDGTTYSTCQAPACCRVVPELYRGLNSALNIHDTLLKLEEAGSAAQPGFMKPEGIVIFHTAANQLFKKTLENDESPKGKNEGI